MNAGVRRRRGIVLPLVLIIGLLLTTAITSFVRKSVVDKFVVDNRSGAAEAAALARGGVQLAIAVLFEDRLQKRIAAQDGDSTGTSLDDLWARLSASSLTAASGAVLTVRIQDSGARLNLNALVPISDNEKEGEASDEAEEFLTAFLERLIKDNPLPRDGPPLDPRELARNLLDYIDIDEVARGGRNENDYYQLQDPPYVAANRPLLSVDEIAMVEGFDAAFADLMRPYVTVHPLVGDAGINFNTAPPHVLSLIYYGDATDKVLADGDLVSRILEKRDAGNLICTETELAPDRCVGLNEVLELGEGSVFPPVELPADSLVFEVVSEARLDDVVYSIEAVVDVSDGSNPRLLSWRAL
jgi:general secretion pathway protein K